MNLKSQEVVQIMNKGIFQSSEGLELESGEKLEQFEIQYTTYGKLNSKCDNVIWVIHALTGDSNPAEWWSGLVGEDKFYDPTKHFIICANLLGSCYGSTNPLSLKPGSKEKYYYDFPDLTTRDLAVSLDKLRDHLGIREINTLIGGSLGGQVALEWAYALGQKLKNLIVLASTAKTSPWTIGFNEAQRMSLECDSTWGERIDQAGQRALKAARAIAMLSYRHPEDFESKHLDDIEKLDDFRASSYLRYQGQKLSQRFNAFSYWVLSKTMDSHDLGRNRGGVENALSKIEARILAVGVNSDLLFLNKEAHHIAKNAQKGTFKEIKSNAGHDAFLIEYEQLSTLIGAFYLEQV
ncbi:homoserine O-acetyltransferase family protein [Algoriphagus sediminis]|uniref:Homoserine O-acetyltransferase n=1 Tax=Algoriphagus sediminis TaxID=3057113 RepID=A0ABT7YDA1_9BACT|nr:homoserine O-acetyltransferase [Algoriphagus sediminis]MDN3204481.1 homoserine O-acetyltransferase [Algoriphagus sediminis]